MISILTKTTGEFVFLDDNYDRITFVDFLDIPENYSYKHVIKFAPDIPEPPHTPEQHLEIHRWNEIFSNFMARENARSM